MKNQNNNNSYYNRNPKSLAGGGQFLFKILVDGWDSKWGYPPRFGRVWADSEYWAVYEAYDVLKFPVNDTFKPKPVRIMSREELQNEKRTS